MSPEEQMRFKYYQDTGKVHPDTQLNASSADIFPGSTQFNVVKNSKPIANWIRNLLGKNQVPYRKAVNKYGSKAKENLNAIQPGKRPGTVRKAANKTRAEVATKNNRLRQTNQKKLDKQVANTNKARTQAATGAIVGREVAWANTFS